MEDDYQTIPVADMSAKPNPDEKEDRYKAFTEKLHLKHKR